MPTIRLLRQVADDQPGAILRVTEDRARRLVDLTGYAERVADEPTPSKRKAKE